MPSTGSVQSVDRAVRVLEILARDGEAGVGQIGRELGVHASTASRLVGALEAHDLIERIESGGRLRLGIGVLRLAGATTPRLDLPTRAQPICDALAEEVGETVNVAVLSDGSAINVCQAQASSTVAMHIWVGRRTVLHATSSGKMLLAHLSDEERDELLGDALERFTGNTRTSPAALYGELREVRERGWATAVEEYEAGLNAVAAPIRGVDGAVVAAITVAGPSYRLAAEALPQMAEVLIRAASEISRRLGHLERATPGA